MVTAGARRVNQLRARVLFGVTTRDVPAYAAAMATVVVVALLALWLPTRRALSINPVSAEWRRPLVPACWSRQNLGG